MAQFAVYRNPNARTRATYPLLLDIQSDLLEDLATRVVIPLTSAPALTRQPMSTLSPWLSVEGQRYLVLTPQLAGVSRADLGSEVANLAAHRDAIIAAIDLLVTGV